MKGNSDTYPNRIEQSNNKTQIRYDVEEVVREDRTSYDYNYVEIIGEVTRAKIINAIIENTYSKDAEIALINNKLSNQESGESEYSVYQLLREHAKEVALDIGYGAV
jgi:hypothetical protein